MRVRCLLAWVVAAVASVAPATPAAGFGTVHLVGPAGETPLRRAASTPGRVVLLVHGLGDADGWVWDRLTPALRARGHDVARFEYRDDTPIAVAADDLVVALARLRARGTRRVDLVAHSMGGLVARDALTRPDGYGGDGAGGGSLPAVDRLITIGTPHRGAALARIRPGRNAAARDLRPGSAFLATLNGRPHPRHTRITTIAGRLVPPGCPCLDAALSGLEGLALRVGLEGTSIRRVERWLRVTLTGIADGVGDGVVTVESASLDGAGDVVVLDAGHQGMVRDLLRAGRVPPAVPIVLDRLEP